MHKAKAIRKVKILNFGMERPLETGREDKYENGQWGQDEAVWIG